MKVVKIIDYRSSTVFIQNHTERILFFISIVSLDVIIMTWTCIEQREQVHKGHGGNRVIRKLIFTEIFIDNITVDVMGNLKPLSDNEIKALTVSTESKISHTQLYCFFYLSGDIRGTKWWAPGLEIKSLMKV